MNAKVVRIGFNDDIPELEKDEARVLLSLKEGKWTHSADLIVFFDRDDGVTIEELKKRILLRAEQVLRKMLE